MLVMAAMVTTAGLGAGAGVRVRPSTGRRASQASDHLGDGHGDGRGEREVDGDMHLAAEVGATADTAAGGGATGTDADALAVGGAVGHVGHGRESRAGRRVEQRRHGDAQQRHEHLGRLVLALLPHDEEDGDGLQERRDGGGAHEEDEGREVAVRDRARARGAAVRRRRRRRVVHGALARRGHQHRRRHR